MKLPASQQANNDQSPSVRLLNKYLDPVHEDLACQKVLDLFSQNSNFFAIAVVDNKNIPIGIIDRNVFLESFLDSSQAETYHKKKISELMIGQPILVDINSTIDDVSEIIIKASQQQVVNGFIITENGFYAGVANGYDLLYEIMKNKQESLFYLAHFDQLTKLPNRLLFMDRLSMSIIEAKRNKSKVGLLFIKLSEHSFIKYGIY